jgi:hypothetical protein
MILESNSEEPAKRFGFRLTVSGRDDKITSFVFRFKETSLVSRGEVLLQDARGKVSLAKKVSPGTPFKLIFQVPDSALESRMLTVMVKQRDDKSQEVYTGVYHFDLPKFLPVSKPAAGKKRKAK